MKEALTILLADTSEQLGQMAQDALAEQNINVILCEKDGQSVLDAICNYAPDAVLVDAFMAKLDAQALKRTFDTLPKEKVKSRKTVFFAMGNFDSPEMEFDLIEAGFRYYFLKP
ncbi:MAG: hypothetical protein RR052_04220, partial [Oscillospiraceae bacterium]